jgi:group I intron endonuclease
MTRVQILGMESVNEEPKISQTIKENPYDSGIYRFTNKINNKVYIGSSKNIQKRKEEHIFGKKGGSKLLYLAISKYGIENFEFEILEPVFDENKLFEREQIYLDFYNLKDLKTFQTLTYNLNPCAKGARGLKWTNKQKENLKIIRNNDSRRFRKHKESTKIKIGLKAKERLKDPTKNPNYGKKVSKETIEKSLKTMERTLLKTFYYIDINNIVHGPFKNVSKFCKDNPIYEESCVLKCLNKKRPHYKNLIFYYEN